MTRFLDTIKAFQYNDKVKLGRLKPPDMLDLSQTTEATLCVGTSYTIEIRFRTQTQVPHEFVENAIDNTRQEIADYVYGEINKELTEWFSDLRCSHNIDYKECEVFYKILDKMK
jgi:hypothetical protein